MGALGLNRQRCLASLQGTQAEVFGWISSVVAARATFLGSVFFFFRLVDDIYQGSAQVQSINKLLRQNFRSLKIPNLRNVGWHLSVKENPNL
jgi:hypothetical protein